MQKLAPLFVCIAMSFSLGACEGRRALREWQPSDHQPPPTVAPEGQGTGSEDDEGSANARAAQTLWAARCATCHGAEGRGDGPGKPPGTSMPDLSSAAYQSTRSNVELHTVIKAGRGMMPAFGTQLTDVGIEELVKHVRTLAKP
ncbi:MAG: cytochrome c [Polyangiales bacterium]